MVEALFSVVNPIEIPYVGVDKKISKKIFFKALEKFTNLKDSDAKVYISSGVVWNY